MYLSIDIGTGSVKAALVDPEGNSGERGRSPVRVEHRDRRSHTVDPRDWLRAAAEAVSVATASDRRGIRAVAVSGNGPTLVSCEADGAPTAPAMLWMDTSATEEAREAGEIAGYVIDPAFYLPKAMRMMRVDERTRLSGSWFLSCPEYLVFALTGEAVAYLPAPGYERLLGERDLVGKLGLPVERFPRFVRHGQVVGLVREGNPVGIPAGIPVVAAYPDFLASVVGSGAVRPGRACDRSGSSEVLNFCAACPFPDSRLLSLPHAIDGLWNVSGGLSTSGKALEWLSGTFLRGPRSSAADVIALAARSRPGARGALFLPYLSGERAPLWDPDLRGSFLGLSIEHEAADLARAAVEGTCFGLRYALDIARSGGIGAESLRASGVLACDPFVARVKASITGAPVAIPLVAESELVGDACACAVALGDAPDFGTASDRLSRIKETVDPDRAGSSELDERYGEFLDALDRTALLSRDLAKSQDDR